MENIIFRKWTCPFAYVCMYFAFSILFSSLYCLLFSFVQAKKIQKKSARKKSNRKKHNKCKKNADGQVHVLVCFLFFVVTCCFSFSLLVSFCVFWFADSFFVFPFFLNLSRFFNSGLLILEISNGLVNINFGTVSSFKISASPQLA